MTVTLFQYELRSWLRAPTTQILFVVCCGFGILLTANGAEFQNEAAGALVNANAPYVLFHIAISVCVFGTVIAPTFAADAALRDHDHGMADILWATPLRRRSFIASRFLGAWSAYCLALSGILLGLAIGETLPWADTDVLGPFNGTAYLQCFWLILLPATFACSAILFTTALLTRSTLACYVTAILLLFLYLLTGESNILPDALDPYLFEVFEDQTRYWTAVERNQHLLPLDAALITNRLLWILIGFTALTPAALRFNPRTTLVHAQRSAAPANGAPPPSSGARGTVRRGSHVAWYQWGFRTWFEIKTVLLSFPFLAVLIAGGFLLTVTLLEREIMYGVNALPLTRVMAASINGVSVWMLLAVLLFYSAEMVWRERRAGIDALCDAQPISDIAWFSAKVVALLAVLTAILLVGVAAAVTIQTLSGYSHYEMWLYAKKVGLHFAPQFYCLAILAMFFQVLTGNTFTGILMMMLYFGAAVGMIDGLGIEHPLLRYGLSPMGAPLSDMNGAGRFETATHYHLVYWASAAGLILIATALLQQRGPLPSLIVRGRGAMHALTRPAVAVPTTLLALTLAASAAVIAYNVHVLNPYQTRTDKTAARIRYERQFSDHQSLPMPRITAVKIAVDLFPDSFSAVTRGSYDLCNQTDQPINEVHLVFPPGTEVHYITLAEAHQSAFDRDFNHVVLQLSRPMAPGETRQLAFETTLTFRGFPHNQPDTRIVGNGTFLHNNHLTPHVGFNPHLRLRDPHERQRAGLAPLAAPADENDGPAGQRDLLRADSDFISYEAIISTNSRQRVLTVGDLVREWRREDRRYFHFKTPTPIRHLYGILSAEYQTMQQDHNGVAISIHHHPQHTHSLDRMMQGAVDGLDYYGRHFGPYTWNHLRIAAFPAYRNFAQSLPGLMPYSEGMGFVADVGPDDIDMPYYVTAHETAHQWWGHLLAPADREGASFLMESLAQYSALMVMEQRYGANKMRRFLAYELDTYLSERARDPNGERPLARVAKQAYIHYQKGSLAMIALKDAVGADRVNRTLRRLIEEHGSHSGGYASAGDFLRILKEETQREHHPLIEALFERITLWDMRAIQVDVTRQTDGRTRVVLNLSLTCFQSDAYGDERRVPSPTAVDIGLFSRHPDDPAFTDKDVILLQKHAVDEQSRLVFTVAQAPRWIGIDPYHKLIDRKSDDNLLAVGPVPTDD